MGLLGVFDYKHNWPVFEEGKPVGLYLSLKVSLRAGAAPVSTVGGRLYFLPVGTPHWQVSLSSDSHYGYNSSNTYNTHMYVGRNS